MKRWSFFVVCVAGLATIALALLLNTPALGQEFLAGVPPAGPGMRQNAPALMALNPDEAPNNLDTTIVVTGTGFQAVLNGSQVLTAPVVSLGDFDLPGVGWISSRTLTATVPWGLGPGVYTATVTNPDGQSGSLPAAFTVTQAIGVWTTGGPYGGSVEDMAVSPIVSRTALAVVYRVGLVRTEDGGDSWSVAVPDIDARGVRYGLAPTYTLYYWGRSGLWFSNDDGRTFELKLAGMIPAFAPDTQDPQRLWMGKDQDIMCSADGGQTWETRMTGLPISTWPSWLTVDPLTPSTIYVAYVDDQVYKTVDSGLHWLPASNGLPAAQHGSRVRVHPFLSNVLLYSAHHGIEPAYRSTDGGGSWVPVNADALGEVFITDLDFSPYVSGTVYASLMGADLVGISTDGGATWTAFARRDARDHVISIALDPATGLPAYLGGGDSGVSRSRDGGHSWELATYGIPGLRLGSLAAVPGKPQTVYATAAGGGGFTSNSAGDSWQQLPLPYPGGTIVKVDAQQPNRIYIHAGHDLFRTQDGGVTWQNVYLPELWHDAYIEAIAIASSEPSILYVAGRDDAAWVRDISVGLAFRSDDFGVTWGPLTFTLPVSGVADIAVDPTDSQRVYVAAGTWSELSAHIGKGVFRSSDGGQTWQKSSEGMGDLPAFSLAIQPDHPQTIYATAWLTREEKLTVFKSTDAGDTWVTTTLRAEWDYPGEWVPSLVIDPLSPAAVYVGTSNGLFRSANGGLTWTKPVGEVSQVYINCLGIASDESRTILYVGTLGGLTGNSDAAAIAKVVRTDAGYVPGGVYQQTIAHLHAAATVYLPLVLKSQ
jgi:photosystem II stability/assembly factor-like uncharacterized protein